MLTKEQLRERMVDIVGDEVQNYDSDGISGYRLIERIEELLEKEYLPDIMIKFVHYLHHEQSFAVDIDRFGLYGEATVTLDPDDLMREYAQEFLATK